MTITELEQVIQEYFLDIYKKKYVGRINILKLDPIGYCIRFGMDRPFKPLVIYAELEDDKFLKFLREELKTKRFNLIYYGEVNLTHPYDCNPRNSACSCYDKE